MASSMEANPPDDPAGPGIVGDTHKNTCVLMKKNGALDVQTAHVSLDDMESGSVLISTLYSEVCGTDVHLKHGRLDLVPYPIIPGHVSVGRVRHVAGEVCDVEGAQVLPGMDVTFLDVIDTCNACVTCLVDKQSTRCPHRRVLGITCRAFPHSVRGLLGGWSTHTYLPPGAKIIRLPAQLPPRVFMAGGCGLPTALHAIDCAAIRLMDRVVVQGSGPVGLLAAILARLSGALQVIVIGAPRLRLEVVRQFGVDATVDIQQVPDPQDRLEEVRRLTCGRLPDVVIEATGVPSAVPEGLAMCRDGGTYVVVGQYTDQGEVGINPHRQINRKHLTIRGCWGSDFSHFHRGVQFMAKYARELPWDLVLSKEFGLSETEAALAAVETLQVFKALIKP